MTKEEAITALGDRNNLLWGMSKEEQKYYSEALDMAISALEKNESAEEWYKLLCEKWDEGDYVCNIPKGMANGEVLQALFPNMKTEDTSVESLIGTNIDRGYVVFQRDWWNEPYKAESEEV